MDASSETASTEVVGTHEIHVRLGPISRQRTHQIVNRPDFPQPIAELGQGRVWLASDVEEWIEKHRPRRVAAR